MGNRLKDFEIVIIKKYKNPTTAIGKIYDERLLMLIIGESKVAKLQIYIARINNEWMINVLMMQTLEIVKRK